MVAASSQTHDPTTPKATWRSRWAGAMAPATSPITRIHTILREATHGSASGAFATATESQMRVAVVSVGRPRRIVDQAVAEPTPPMITLLT